MLGAISCLSGISSRIATARVIGSYRQLYKGRVETKKVSLYYLMRDANEDARRRKAKALDKESEEYRLRFKWLMAGIHVYETDPIMGNILRGIRLAGPDMTTGRLSDLDWCALERLGIKELMDNIEKDIEDPQDNWVKRQGPVPPRVQQPQEPDV